MMPRLPVNRPRCGVAMMSPDGVTRFCSGICYARSFIAVIPGWCASTRPGISRFRVRCFASPRNDSSSRRAVAERRLERERGIPGKEDPGVLRHFGDEGIDQRPSLRLGVDGCEMRVRHHVAHQPPGLAGVDEIIDDQESLAGAAAEFRRIGGYALQNLQVALPGV